MANVAWVVNTCLPLVHHAMVPVGAAWHVHAGARFEEDQILSAFRRGFPRLVRVSAARLIRVLLCFFFMEIQNDYQ